MKRIAFGLIALLLTALVLTAGGTPNISNPLTSSKSDYSANFARSALPFGRNGRAWQNSQLCFRKAGRKANLASAAWT
jgi:hypothetical protein